MGAYIWPGAGSGLLGGALGRFSKKWGEKNLGAPKKVRHFLFKTLKTEYLPLAIQQLTVSHLDKPRRRAPHARRTAHSTGWARGKGADSHRCSVVRAGAAGSASAAGKFPDETKKLTGEPGLWQVPAELCCRASRGPLSCPSRRGGAR